MSDTDRLAALLEELSIGCDAHQGDDEDTGLETHRTDAARLRAAGVTLDPRPAPDTHPGDAATILGIVLSTSVLSDKHPEDCIEMARPMLAHLDNLGWLLSPRPTPDTALREAAREFIEDHDGDEHADASWPCDGRCVQARNLRAALRGGPR